MKYHLFVIFCFIFTIILISGCIYSVDPFSTPSMVFCALNESLIGKNIIENHTFFDVNVTRSYNYSLEDAEDGSKILLYNQPKHTEISANSWGNGSPLEYQYTERNESSVKIGTVKGNILRTDMGLGMTLCRDAFPDIYILTQDNYYKKSYAIYGWNCLLHAPNIPIDETPKAWGYNNITYLENWTIICRSGNY